MKAKLQDRIIFNDFIQSTVIYFNFLDKFVPLFLKKRGLSEQFVNILSLFDRLTIVKAVKVKAKVNII